MLAAGKRGEFLNGQKHTCHRYAYAHLHACCLSEGRSWAAPPLLGSLAYIEGSVIIDAEAVYLDAKGGAQFDLLYSRLNDRVAIATAFDLLMLNDEDMQRKPFIECKAALRKLLRQNEDIQYVAHIKGDGAKMFQAV